MATQDPIRITKYTNRRLYDATNSRHLTLDQLIELIKDGHDVEVIAVSYTHLTLPTTPYV